MTQCRTPSQSLPGCCRRRPDLTIRASSSEQIAAARGIERRRHRSGRGRHRGRALFRCFPLPSHELALRRDVDCVARRASTLSAMTRRRARGVLADEVPCSEKSRPPSGEPVSADTARILRFEAHDEPLRRRRGSRSQAAGRGWPAVDAGDRECAGTVGGWTRVRFAARPCHLWRCGRAIRSAAGRVRRPTSAPAILPSGPGRRGRSWRGISRTAPTPHPWS